jgi:8-oxo-dGTP pyrophosphatase MutT (NUDIX family)
MKEKTKVLSYIFRNTDEGQEVLVFIHRDLPEAGIQVVGGTVDAGEDLVEALIRELYEESGLRVLAHECSKIGESVYYRQDFPEKNLRHYFEVKISLPHEFWSHKVKSTGMDDGLVFEFFWMPTSLAKVQLVGKMGELLP